jgi:hypothetical protein
MKWPWVSRGAFEAVCGERDRLIEQNGKLLDHVKRVDRAEHGLAEVPREPRKKIESMPDDLAEHLNAFADPSIRRAQRNEAYKRHLAGESWEAIKREAMTPKPVWQQYDELEDNGGNGAEPPR